MKHGATCPGCRVYMVFENGEFVCPECGHAEPARAVEDDLTPRPVAPFDAKAFFEKLKRAAE